jgi:hypothetical protein
MERPSRRNLLRAVAAGGAAAAGIGVALRSGFSTDAMAQGNSLGHSHGHARPPDGPLANATVSFGHWKTDLPLDRFPNIPPAPPRNAHLMTPNEPTIKAGGSVSFIISGLHNLQVYDAGTEPADVNISLIIPMTGPAPLTGLPVIDDPNGRLYRGPDPSLLPLDRVEVVNFASPGRYLVICGFLFHFNDLMYGYVNVIR